MLRLLNYMVFVLALLVCMPVTATYLWDRNIFEEVGTLHAYSPATMPVAKATENDLVEFLSYHSNITAELRRHERIAQGSPVHLVGIDERQYCLVPETPCNSGGR